MFYFGKHLRGFHGMLNGRLLARIAMALMQISFRRHTRGTNSQANGYEYGHQNKQLGYSADIFLYHSFLKHNFPP